MSSKGIDKGGGREEAVKLLGGRICCIVGILFGAGGILFALLGASANVSAVAVGAALGILGYFLGARRLGATIVLGVITVLFMATAATGLIPGVAPLGHGYN